MSKKSPEEKTCPYTGKQCTAEKCMAWVVEKLRGYCKFVAENKY